MKKFLKRVYPPLIKLILLTISLMIYFFVKDTQKTKQEISKGRIQYFKGVGWVDWGHAIPTGPQKLVDDLILGKDTIEYYQDMKKSFFGRKLIIRLSNTYCIPSALSAYPKEISCYIFNDVSKAFEHLQKSWPYRPVCGIGIGDTNGDKIALLRALQIDGYDAILGTPESSEYALRHFSQHGDQKDDSSSIDTLLPREMAVKKCNSKIEYIFETNIPSDTTYQ